MSSLIHRQPCAECPWRKKAAKGWLGGHTAESYADAVQANEVPACHLRDFGPDDDRTAFCAGSLAVMSNQCVSAWRSDGGDEAKKGVGKRPDCFAHVREFYKHHTEQEYIHPLMRKS